MGGEAASIDMNAYSEWRQAWLRQILIAGARTAIVLNDILDAKQASKLHEGSKVKTKADQEMEEQKKEWAKEREKINANAPKASGASWSPAIMMKNLGIASITVPVFLLIVNHGLNPLTWLKAIQYTLGAE